VTVSEKSTLYVELEDWASSQDMTADDLISVAVDGFYARAISDPRLSKFFENSNVDNLKTHQRSFMQRLFSGEEAGGYTSEQLYKIHEDLIVNKGLKTIHFDYFVDIFLSALRGEKLSPQLMQNIQAHLKPFRRIFEQATTEYFMSREERLFFALDDDGDGSVPESDIREALKRAGLGPEDNRLEDLYKGLMINQGEPLNLRSFSQIIGTSGLLVERALQGGLAIPDFQDFSKRVDEIYEIVKKNISGLQAQYIPPLAEAEPEKFGVAIVTTDGQVYTQGDHGVDFSIQSMCKPFNYCFAVEELGADEVHSHVGNEPSGRAFNDRDLMARLFNNRAEGQAEKVEIPFNPMINAGAIMTAALVKSHEPFKERFRHVREMWARMIGKPQNQAGSSLFPRFNKEMARQENFTGFNNLALGYLLMATGLLPHEKTGIPEDSVPDDPDDYEFIVEQSVLKALKLYFGTCSLELNTKEMAIAAATLANGGVCPLTQERVLEQSTVRSCLAITEMCGMYDGSGDFFYNIGLPAKSGVGGGVILVVPRLMGICIFSPRLDAQGNSVRGVEMARRFIEKYRLHSYDAVMTDSSRIDPRLPLSRWRAIQVSEALWAASKGDVRTLQRLLGEQYNLELGDYDQRTPMHLAAAGGHIEVIEFLLKNDVSPMADRWGGFPISDALENGHYEIAELFNARGYSKSDPVHLVEKPDGAQADGADYGDDFAVVELLWAASENDIPGLRRMVAQGVPVHAQDYDKRTALHLAASEGQLDAVKYLVAHGHPLIVRDRWLATPLDEAKREGRGEVVAYLEQQG
jgi:glutaminase